MSPACEMLVYSLWSRCPILLSEYQTLRLQSKIVRQMELDNYKVVLYRNWPTGWIAEIPSVPGCYALMPTRTEALTELEQVFLLLEGEYRDKSASMPIDTTEIVQA